MNVRRVATVALLGGGGMVGVCLQIAATASGNGRYDVLYRSAVGGAENILVMDSADDTQNEISKVGRRRIIGKWDIIKVKSYGPLLLRPDIDVIFVDSLRGVKVDTVPGYRIPREREFDVSGGSLSRVSEGHTALHPEASGVSDRDGHDIDVGAQPNLRRLLGFSSGLPSGSERLTREFVRSTAMPEGEVNKAKSDDRHDHGHGAGRSGGPRGIGGPSLLDEIPTLKPYSLVGGLAGLIGGFFVLYRWDRIHAHIKRGCGGRWRQLRAILSAGIFGAAVAISFVGAFTAVMGYRLIWEIINGRLP